MPVESLLEGVVESLGEQFESERYKPIRVSGRTFDSTPFNREIEPVHIQGHGMVTVTLTPDLPEDENERWMTAQLASQITDPKTGEPAFSLHTIRDKVMRVQDSLLEKQRVFAQQARGATPAMYLLTMLEAAIREEDQGAVQFVGQELQDVLEQKQMERIARMVAFMQLVGQDAMAAAVQGVNGANGAQGGGGRGTPPNPLNNVQPEMVPLSGTVFGRSNPPPDAGANTVGNVRERLANVGLEYAAR
jgi:hypothetical protein